MPHSDSEEEGVDDLEFDRTSEADGDEDVENDDDILDAAEGDAGAEDASEGDDDSLSDDSDDGSEDDEDDDSEHSGLVEGDQSPSVPLLRTSRAPSSPPHSQHSKAPSPVPPHTRSLSPGQLRRKALLRPGFHAPRSYTVEAICALPHPVPTHALASSLCMTHLLTGSEDGYIRDYDIFSAVNGKIFLTAPQRHHCGVVEGIMKSGQIRFWWENPAVKFTNPVPGEEDLPLSPVYSLLMHSDALWALAGTDAGHINLFTVRHDPGRLCHVMNGHRGPVSALSMQHDEKGFFSAGWDGDALQWDLNTGQIVRHFTAHGAQLAALATRPATSAYLGVNSSPIARPETMLSKGPSDSIPNESNTGPLNSEIAAEQSPYMAIQPIADSQLPQEPDSKSDTSFDPLFDDEPDAYGEPDNDPHASQQNNEPVVSNSGGVQPTASYNSAASQHPVAPDEAQMLQPQMLQPPGRGSLGIVAPPKNAPPLLHSSVYANYSPDILMTASIDGQVILWDKRVQTLGKGVGRLWMSEKTPPWCLSACWSADGSQVYAGRRNGTVDVWDVRQLGRSGPNATPKLLKTLRNPLSSGVVSCVVAFPDGRHIACASNDNIRLWNAAEAGEADGSGKTKSGVQFKIIPGHHGGYISQMLVDPGARFLVSASSNRGWHGDSTRTVFVHDVKHVQ